MHPDRFSFLAGKHAQRRQIISKKRTDGGHWLITLECGHGSSCVGHFDISKTETWNCFYCGQDYVRNAPQYAKEFQS